MLYQQIVPAFIREPLEAQTKSTSIWLVGGAVRDYFLGEHSKDLDFAVDGNARRTARRFADSFGGAYFDLDRDRDAGRVLIVHEGDRWTLDFTGLRGGSIETDLMSRDFTINAIAVSTRADSELIDVNLGLQDLKRKVISHCNPDSLMTDPIRVLRLARFSAKLGFQIERDTRACVAQATPHLGAVSWERIRDELFQILAPPRISTGVRLLDRFKVLSVILPEMNRLKELKQSPPHAFDVWNHTLAVIKNLEDILLIIQAVDVNAVAGNLNLAEIALALLPFKETIRLRMANAPSSDRTIAQLLAFSALYHDSGKAQTRSQDADGRIRFLGHESVSASLAQERAKVLRLSNIEANTISTVVANHMRPAQLAKQVTLSKRAIFRFTRSGAQASVDILLLSLADFLGKEIPPANQDELAKRLRACVHILEFQKNQKEDPTSKTPLIKGDELMQQLDLPPGPAVGELLKYIQEARAVGAIHSKEEAIQLAKQAIENG
jgi:tRNA nucleotidyltransferase/poly(A) polymerase